MDSAIPPMKDTVLVWVLSGKEPHPAYYLKHVDEHHIRVQWAQSQWAETVHVARVCSEPRGRGQKRGHSSAAEGDAESIAERVQRREASRQELLRSRIRRKQVMQQANQQSGDDDDDEDDRWKPLIAILPHSRQKVLVKVVFKSANVHREARLRADKAECRVAGGTSDFEPPGEDDESTELCKPRKRKRIAQRDNGRAVAQLPETSTAAQQQVRSKPGYGYDPDDSEWSGDGDSGDSSDDELDVPNIKSCTGETVAHSGTSIDDSLSIGSGDTTVRAMNDEAGVRKKQSDCPLLSSKSVQNPPRYGYSDNLLPDFRQKSLLDGQRKTWNGCDDTDSSDDDALLRKPCFTQGSGGGYDTNKDENFIEKKEATPCDEANMVKNSLLVSGTNKTETGVNAKNRETTMSGAYSVLSHKSCQIYPQEGESCDWGKERNNEAQNRNSPICSSGEDGKPEAGSRRMGESDAPSTRIEARLLEKDTDCGSSYQENGNGEEEHHGIGEASVFERDTEDDASFEPGIRDHHRGVAERGRNEGFGEQKAPNQAPVHLTVIQSLHASEVNGLKVHGAFVPPSVERGATDNATTTSYATRNLAEEEQASIEVDRLLHESNNEYYMYCNFPFIDAPQLLDPKETLRATKMEYGCVELLDLLRMKMCGKCGERLGIYFHMYSSERKLMGTSCSMCHFNIGGPFNAPFQFSQPAWTANQAEQALALPGLENYLMSRYSDNALELPNGTLVFKDEIVTQCAVEVCGSVWEFHRAVVMLLRNHVDAAPAHSSQQGVIAAEASGGSLHKGIEEP